MRKKVAEFRLLHIERKISQLEGKRSALDASLSSVIVERLPIHASTSKRLAQVVADIAALRQSHAASLASLVTLNTRKHATANLWTEQRGWQERIEADKALFELVGSSSAISLPQDVSD